MHCCTALYGSSLLMNGTQLLTAATEQQKLTRGKPLLFSLATPRHTALVAIQLQRAFVSFSGGRATGGVILVFMITCLRLSMDGAAPFFSTISDDGHGDQSSEDIKKKNIGTHSSIRAKRRKKEMQRALLSSPPPFLFSPRPAKPHATLLVSPAPPPPPSPPPRALQQTRHAGATCGSTLVQLLRTPDILPMKSTVAPS